MELDQLPAADVVVALAGCHSRSAIQSAAAVVADGVRAVSPELRVIAVHADAAGPSIVGDGSQGEVTLFAHSFTTQERNPPNTSAQGDAYRSLFLIARRANARAALILGSDPDSLDATMVQVLLQPVLDGTVDVVTPRYARRKFDGLINRAIVYPLTRALYGKRIEGQVGLDYAFSQQVAARWPIDGAGRAGRAMWILPQAVSEGLAVGEARLGIRLPPASDGADVSSVLSQVLGPLFLDLERHAPFWQRVVRTQAVPTFGAASPDAGESAGFDVRPLIESFQLAYRNLQDVWGLVLPPATLIELKRLTQLGAKDFRLPDDLWARIVFDFALGYRIRAINRDHLVRALTPAYLAWVAAYALEIGDAPPAAAHERLERLGLAFEAEKPYLLRRWRWPDRFNP